VALHTGMLFASHVQDKLTCLQREWEKVWHAQTQAMYLKSLDHMGLHVKSADKKNFAMKHLIDSIKTKHEEQRRHRTTRIKGMPSQFVYKFGDQPVILDVLRIMLFYINNVSQHNSAERRRVSEFFEKFITVFFDIPEELVADRTGDIDRGTPDDDLDDVTPSELPNGRGRRPNNAKRTDLRRGVLDRARNGTRGRGIKEDSATGSKESTPDVDSVVDDDAGEATEDQATTEVTNDRWLALPGAAAVQGTKPLDAADLELIADQPFKRDFYSLFCNSTIYVFFSIFQTLYRRFKEIKESEEEAVLEGKRAKVAKPAKEIGLLDDQTEYYGLAPGEGYYGRTLTMIEDFIIGDLEETKFQDFLRHYYLKKGWQLYTVMDLLKSLCRQAVVCSSNDSKERTPDLIEQFYHDKESKETSFNAEINLRKQADKYIKDGELFVIRWVCTLSLAYQTSLTT
jgi:paired amphipathic helix protein Sin3a